MLGIMMIKNKKNGSLNNKDTNILQYQLLKVLFWLPRKSVLKFIMILFFVILYKPAPNSLLQSWHQGRDCIWVVSRTMLVYKVTLCLRITPLI